MTCSPDRAGRPAAAFFSRFSAEQALWRARAVVNTYCVTDSRTRLLEAAAEEFARYGLKGTRVQAIVQRAGVNERMIYHHFGSKDGLYTAVVEHLRRQAGASMATLLADTAGMPPYPAMRQVLAGMFDEFRLHPYLSALFAHESLAGRESSPFPAPEQLPAGVRAIYEAGQRDGVFLADRPFEIAYMTSIGALVGLAHFAQRFAAGLGRGDWTDAAYLRDQIVTQLVDGLTGPTGDTALH
jgi:AcrR family transcriptional regulator